MHTTTADLYLDLLKRTLTRHLFIDNPIAAAKRAKGLDWPTGDGAETMIGLERLTNIQQLIEKIYDDEIPGDLMECGVWRGGAAIFMRACLNTLNHTHAVSREDYRRCVWVADSFRGLPPPDPARYPVDRGDEHHKQPFLAVPLSQVISNFSRYNLLDDRVQFLSGFFRDSLPGPVKQLSLLRIDADMYESTTQALEAMYPLLSPGGAVIIDDYLNIPRCHQAVDDYRSRYSITVPMTAADWCAVWWLKPLK